MKPDALIDPWKSKIDLVKLACHLYERQRGHARRIKIRDLCVLFLGVAASGNRHPADPAMRDAIDELVSEGNAIITADGPEGGVWWCADEQERAEAMHVLERKARGMLRRRDALGAASLIFLGPKQGSLL